MPVLSATLKISNGSNNSNNSIYLELNYTILLSLYTDWYRVINSLIYLWDENNL